MSLTDRQFVTLQDHIATLVDRIAELHLNIEVEYDLSTLVTFLESVGAFINPTFDPRYCSATPGSFWVRVTDDDGKTVACHSAKLYEVDDFFELIENEQLWFDADKQESYGKGRMDAVLRRPAQTLSGKIAHSGALWVSPAHRKRGLSLYMPYLSRALTMRNHDIDYQTCIVLKSLKDSGIPTKAYGYPHVESCIRGYFPVTGRLEEIFFCYMSRRELIDRIHALESHPEYPVTLRAAV